ncbi:Hypothetical predicted protein [Xyrichtys novacula]|uniref:Uncharacterized protein n=1 Tax=Xyrichtys novacula TaxID=13765 RepID=A0AAV1FCZ5_XYRNO|nr:Hypothetical predicted protein [Xyrichtys novacula]
MTHSPGRRCTSLLASAASSQTGEEVYKSPEGEVSPPRDDGLTRQKKKDVAVMIGSVHAAENSGQDPRSDWSEVFTGEHGSGLAAGSAQRRRELNAPLMVLR